MFLSIFLFVLWSIRRFLAVGDKSDTAGRQVINRIKHLQPVITQHKSNVCQQVLVSVYHTISFIWQAFIVLYSNLFLYILHI